MTPILEPEHRLETVTQNAVSDPHRHRLRIGYREQVVVDVVAHPFQARKGNGLEVSRGCKLKLTLRAAEEESNLSAFGQKRTVCPDLL